MNIVIIEDEKITAKDLANTLLEVNPEIKIHALLHSVEEAIDFLQKNKNIDLIFSDIQLGDGLSFDVFETVHNQIPIIFCTAFNEYALQAFETSGISYILKPFSKQTVSKAIEKFKQLQTQQTPPVIDYNSIIQSIQAKIIPTKLPNIIVNKGEKIIPVSGENIALFYIDQGIIKAQTFDKETLVVTHTLDELEAKFSPSFFRANRQFLLNRGSIKEASQHFNRKLLVRLNIPFNEEILVGKEKTTSFLNWLSEF
jgi:two-component system, LytTR family, response regulator LytT